MSHEATTIFALSSGAGRAAIAVIRISGPEAASALRALTGHVPPPRTAKLVKLYDPDSGDLLDNGVVLLAPGPKSLTGEDVVELHLHGGLAVVAGVSGALSRMRGLRPAEAGEFTRRAFLNGKLDLTEVEGVADLVNAETEAQRKQAMRQMAGEFGRLAESWRDRLMQALAHTEARIDFAEDDPEAKRSAGDVAGVAGEIRRHLDDGRRGERLREGFAIAILGPPNAGKSSLLNRIAGREAAIVSTQEGTTRDVIEVHLDLGGLPVSLADTAGLREAADEIESEGVRRALARAEAADLKLVVIAADEAGKLDAAAKRVVDASTVIAANKADLAPERTAAQIKSALESQGAAAKDVLLVSAKSGAGISELLARLETEAREGLGGGGAAPAITRARHREALESCVSALERYQSAAEPELAAEELRAASHALGRITGRVDVEDLLDIIFRDFCIGK